MAKIKVTLVKSLIGRKKDHIATANALGLRKINKTVEHEDTPQIRGMINKVDYLLMFPFLLPVLFPPALYPGFSLPHRRANQ